MACCPKLLCPRWYSGFLGFIKMSDKVSENKKVLVANTRFEKEGKFIPLEATDELIQMFKDEKVDHDYGIIILKSKIPEGKTKEDALVVAFLSFYRQDHNPDHDILKRVSLEKGFKEYDRLFEEFFSETKLTAY
jgi:hypothetical protein